MERKIILNPDALGNYDCSAAQAPGPPLQNPQPSSSKPLSPPLQSLSALLFRAPQALLWWCDAMSPTPAPALGLFESIFTQIWVSCLSRVISSRPMTSSPLILPLSAALASWFLGPIPPLIHGLLCLGDILELPVLLVSCLDSV